PRHRPVIGDVDTSKYKLPRPPTNLPADLGSAAGTEAATLPLPLVRRPGHWQICQFPALLVTGCCPPSAHVTLQRDLHSGIVELAPAQLPATRLLSSRSDG